MTRCEAQSARPDPKCTWEQLAPGGRLAPNVGEVGVGTALVDHSWDRRPGEIGHFRC
jgi:hypothetical protein